MDAGLARRYSRLAGALFIVSLAAGAFGESQVPQSLLLARDLAGTAHKMAASVVLFRASFAAYLVEACCDLTLTVLLYELLRPVSRTVSLLTVCFGLFGTAVFATGEIFYFTAALPVVDADVAKVVPPDLQTLITYLGLTIFGYVFGVFAAFYGITTGLRGYLIFRSGYLPRTLGVLLMIGGASFVAENFLLVLMPQWNVPYILFPMMLAMACMALWLLIKGIDRTRWDQMQSLAKSRS
jgi:hypothetical protein